VAITVFRVVGGFLLAAVVAVPIGIAMGAFKPIEAFFEPLSRSRATCRPPPSSRSSSCGPG
jgi:ABC-type nitrate/sulfonate/bicarbonate transport system permease component